MEASPDKGREFVEFHHKRKTINLCKSFLFLLEKLYSVKFYFNEIRYNDWIAKVERKLTPIHLKKVFIHGTHHKKEVSLNKINIEIQAAMAFGTGHHCTTQLCISIYLDLIKI